ncbi:MAG: hypothetical protein AB1714_26970 [Acidobacteriota bacterium]
MTCEELQTKAIYLAEDDASMREQVEAHIAGCAGCSAWREEYQRVLQAYSRTIHEEAPALVRRRARLPLSLLLAAAATLLVAIGIVFLVDWRPATQEAPISSPASGALTPAPPSPARAEDVLAAPDSDFDARLDAVHQRVASLKRELSATEF